MKKNKQHTMCSSCPFNYSSEESEYAQNMGCLPSSSDILEIKDKTNNNWACHFNNKKVCGGLKNYRDTSTGKLHLQPCENHEWISWDKEDLKPILIDIKK